MTHASGELQLDCVYHWSDVGRFCWYFWLPHASVCFGLGINPSFVSATASGIALLLGIFLLQESNPRVLARKGVKEVEIKDVVNGKVAGDAGVESGDAGVKSGEATQTTDTKNSKATQNDTKQTKPSRPRVTKLMLLCFLHEFCIRWVAMAYNSRYNIYITDRWNVSSTVFSLALAQFLTNRYYITAQSVWYFFQQFFIYPWLITTVNAPIPVLATIGEAIDVICVLLMVLSPKDWQSLLASVVLWAGNSLSSTASVAIISVGVENWIEKQTTNPPDVQGTVISWNNMCCQASLIVTPLVLSSMYTRNWEAPFYLSAGVTAVGALIMLNMSCRKDRNELGKKRLVGETEMPIKDVEVKTDGEVKTDMEVKTELSTKNAEAENAATPTVVAPSANGEPEKVDVPAQTA